MTDSTGSYTSYNDLLTVGAGYLDIQATVTDAMQILHRFRPAMRFRPRYNLDPATGSM